MTTQLSLQFLGSGDTFGSGGRLQTCIYVEAGSTHFLLDCGASSLSAMRRWGVEPNSINAILITHLHGDHFGGLPFFLLDAHLVSKRTQPLIIAGPAGAAGRICQAQEVLFPGSSQIQPRFDLTLLEWLPGQPLQVAGLQVTPYPVIHPSGAPSYALRVEYQDKVLAYSGDTEWTDTLITAAQGADLFICEAYYFDKPVKFHLDYRTLMAHRDALDCKRLILTHMSQDLLDRLGEIEVEYAEDGKQIIL
jgi:ribonuclease BN (tRNA processing enzyme)